MRREIAETVLARSQGRCEARTEKCIGRGQHLHHRKLRSHGGQDRPDNLLHVCLECHTFIHAHPARSYERGWLIRGVT